MQDRFKFRVWCNRRNKYIYNIQDVGADFSIDCWEDCFGDFLCCEDYVLEQCTGLKDKNGKLIYEGDIVLVEDNKCPIEWESENARYNVVGYGEIAYLNYNDIEVIGNIHENPELLEK